MSWELHTPLLDRPGDTSVILHDSRAMGSIMLVSPGKYRVEILWSLGDIVYDAASLQLAKAFVDGIVAAFSAVRAASGARIWE